jgi:hypothetical protein
MKAVTKKIPPTMIYILIVFCFLIVNLFGCNESAGSNSPDSGGQGSDVDSDTDSDTDAYCSETHPDWTIGMLMCDEDAFAGYTLFAPSTSKTTYLVDMWGRLVHSWESDYLPGLAVYLNEDGNLLRTAAVGNEVFKGGGAGGLVQEIDWDGNVVWEFEYSSEKYLSHHDVEKLPNGDLLMIAWELRTSGEIAAAGRDPDLQPGDLWVDTVIEVRPEGSKGGSVVWKWDLWDHLIQDFDPEKDNYGTVEDHPELVDFNFTGTNEIMRDWTHTNAVDYNESLDQIALSVHNMSEIWIIDHSAAIEEAASHAGGLSGKGGDILYRWGNPQVYRAGTADDQKLFSQHDVKWIDQGYPGEGNLLVFNNGLHRPEGMYSSVDEITPPVGEIGDYTLAGEAWGPLEQEWVYTAEPPEGMYAYMTSGAQRLPNGNTLITLGPGGHFYEVTSSKKIVWEYVCPVGPSGTFQQGIPVAQLDKGSLNNGVFRATRYAPGYPGLQGKDLTPQGYLEQPAE